MMELVKLFQLSDLTKCVRKVVITPDFEAGAIEVDIEFVWGLSSICLTRVGTRTDVGLENYINSAVRDGLIKALTSMRENGFSFEYDGKKYGAGTKEEADEAGVSYEVF